MKYLPTDIYIYILKLESNETFFNLMKKIFTLIIK